MVSMYNRKMQGFQWYFSKTFQDLKL